MQIVRNRVNAADFFSNHPFHVRIEEFSRRLYAPSKDGSFRESKWFYERARGQYQDARAHLSQAARRRFDLEYPKRQRFAKTDLAKFVNVWRGKPDIVSRGAQKNFADFARFIGSEWNRQANAFNEMYYREVVAKAIVFRSVERLGGGPNLVPGRLSRKCCGIHHCKTRSRCGAEGRGHQLRQNLARTGVNSRAPGVVDRCSRGGTWCDH